MTSTVTDVRKIVAGNMAVRLVYMDVTSYTTGGETLSPASLGLTAMDAVFATHAGGGTLAGVAIPNWDKANGKLKFNATLAAEVAATSDLGLWYLFVIGSP